MIHIWLRRMRKNTLLMNAFYLMLSTFVVAATGFLFWVIVAHTYSASIIGLATTLLSVSGLLSLVGLAGFDTTFIRFLPKSQRKNEYINSGIILVTLISGGLSTCVAIILSLQVPGLSILGSVGGLIGFVFFTIITSLNVLTNAVFLAFKKARYIFVINVLFSIFKVLLPVIIAPGDAITIFVLAGSAQLIGLFLSLLWMKRKFNYAFSLHLHVDTLRVVRKFSSFASISSILNLLPPTLLPLLVISSVGSKNAAYYYMAFTIAGVLYTIAYASMQSVFTEGSHNEAALRSHMIEAGKLIAVLLIPAAFLVTILSSSLLSVFGPEYAHGAGTLLQLLALSALPVAIYSALGAVFKVTKNFLGMVVMNTVYAVVVLSMSILTVHSGGLMAIGWAWIIGNVTACIVGVFFLTSNKVRRRE